MSNSLVGEIAVTVQGAAGAVNRNRRHNSVATITIGCGLAQRSTGDAMTALDRGYAGRAGSIS